MSLFSRKMARQRFLSEKTMSKSLRSLDDDVYLSHDEPHIDFSSAGLYLVGLQTTLATVACSAASIASCWLLPVSMVSAVRTLAITSLTGALCMRKAVQIGRVKGVYTLFNALRPCVIVYIAVLTIEQLVHTCVAVDQKPNGHTRTFVFHLAVCVVALSGFWRAAKPLSESDGPFIATSCAVVVIALLPPPATPLEGPLCRAATLFGAGERLLRAFFFSALYVVHTYASPPKRNSIQDLSVCVFRCIAASIWVLGCHVYILWLPIVQASVALWARFGSERQTHELQGLYNSIDTRSDGGLSDVELGAISSLKAPRDHNGVIIPAYLREDPPFGVNSDTSTVSPPHTRPPPSPVNEEVMVDPRRLASMVSSFGNVGNSNSSISKSRMAEIAASIN